MGRKEKTVDNQFVAIEGQDGTGKETQVNLLRNIIPNPRVISLPQYGQSSAHFVEAHLRGDYGDLTQTDPYQTAVHYVEDRFDAGLKVKRWLADGDVTIADRWSMSNAAYQGAKVFIRASKKFSIWSETEIFVRWLMNFEHHVMGIPKPLYIFLKVPPKISFDLKSKQHQHQDGYEANLSYQEVVSVIYDHLAQTGLCGTTKIIDCIDPESKKMLPPEAIHQKIVEALGL